MKKSDILTIHYPKDVTVTFNRKHVGRWPKDSFKWVGGLMRESEQRTIVSPEIVIYQSYVLGKADITGFTRNLDVVRSILVFLDDNVKKYVKDHLPNILELCAGTGICTTPLGKEYNVIAVERNPKYRIPFKHYIEKEGLSDCISPIFGDIQNKDTVLKHEKVKDKHFDAVILNPPWSMISECIEIAVEVNPDVIIAVLPLDVIEEAPIEKTDRDETKDIIEMHRYSLKLMRAHWRLIALEPNLRSDGTAQTGTFLFKRKYFDSNGIKIAFAESGTGEPVILVHGLTGSIFRNWMNWGIFQDLSKDHHVIALDCRGHGASFKPPQQNAYGKKMYIDIINLMSYLDIPKAHIIGYSMGGRIVARLLVEYPKKFYSATIAEADVFREKLTKELNTDYLRGNDPEAINSVIASWKDLAVTPTEIKEVKVPIQGICGTKKPCHQQDLKALHKEKPEIQYEEIKGATHLHETGVARNPSFIRLIRRFIKKYQQI